jgi:hypothetical protein
MSASLADAVYRVLCADAKEAQAYEAAGTDEPAILRCHFCPCVHEAPKGMLEMSARQEGWCPVPTMGLRDWWACPNESDEAINECARKAV